MTDLAPDVATVIDCYLEAYAEPDADRRAALVAQVWSDDGQLIDPPFDGEGREAIAAMSDVLLANFPGHTFDRTTEVDHHHGFARYGWALVAPDGTASVIGTDIAEVDESGRLVRIIGFFGDPTPKAA